MLSRESWVRACALASCLASVLTAAAGPLAYADEGQSSCSLLDDPVYSRIRPTSQAQLVTPWMREADGAAARYGYTEDQGVLFRALVGAGDGDADQAALEPVHRLAKYRAGDFRYSLDPAEIRSAIEAGYVDQGTRFSASNAAADCLMPVKQYVKDDKHRLAITAEAQDALTQEGWTYDRVAFYAAPGDGATAPEPPETDDDSRFSFAVMPDTQQEVLRANDTRFADRTSWLADQESELDLRWVTHTGDVVNWDTPDHAQYEVASRAMEPLERADIPFSLAVGNHDTAAVCSGGGACDSRLTRTLFRDTSTFNRYFTPERFGVDGAFEAGKVDNSYSTYSSGGLRWMVLTIEMWPRASAVSWAKKIVAEHPEHNVIVVTHNYLTDNGGLEQSGQYGDTSPQKIFNEFVSQYRNIRMVFSGHVGTTANRTDTGVHGNKIYSFLQTIHSTTTNPVRLVEVDAEDETIKTWIYSPYTRQNYPEWTRTFDDVDWVR